MLIGLDGNLVEFDNGINAIFSTYIAYNGASLKYDDTHINTHTKIDQNGANLGVMGTFYRDNFFGAVSVGVGINKSTVKIWEGNSSFNSYVLSAGLKGGYNFKLPCDLIIQPNLTLNYSYINSKS